MVYRLWNRPRLLVGSASFSPGLAVLVALTLAVLNPIMCLIHCAAMDALIHQAHTYQIPTSGGSFFLCDMPFQTVQSHVAATAERIQSSTTAASTLPRAVYESVTSVPPFITLFLILMAHLNLLNVSMSSRNTPPPTPPPRAG